MLRKLLCAVGMCLASATASADVPWVFSYAGFQNETTGLFLPQIAIRGVFRGEDINLDGTLQQSELTEFELDDVWFDLSMPGSCKFNYCTLDNFNYNLRTGDLHFSARTEYRDEMTNIVTVYELGQQWAEGFGTPWGSSQNTWLWTDQTRFKITPAPVPEPASAWLLGAGLVAVSVAARRRR